MLLSTSIACVVIVVHPIDVIVVAFLFCSSFYDIAHCIVFVMCFRQSGTKSGDLLKSVRFDFLLIRPFACECLPARSFTDSSFFLESLCLWRSSRPQTKISKRLH